MPATPLLQHKLLEANTDTEAIDRALTLVVTEAKIDSALRAARGKTKLTKVFR